LDGRPTPIPDVVTQYFPMAQKFQSFNFGPAVALSGSEWQRNRKE
jgi:hypothetical protein